LIARPLAGARAKGQVLAMATRTVGIALDARAELGEGPRWHGAERRLYWVDIARNELHRFDPATGADEVRGFEAPVGCFAFRAGGGLLLAMKDGLAVVDDWDGAIRPFGEQLFRDRPDLRFNDGRTDPAGRFWAGSVNMTKNARDAALYRVDADGTIELVEGGMLTCNGAAFDAAGTAAAMMSIRSPGLCPAAASCAASRKGAAGRTAAPSMRRAATGPPCSTAAGSCALAARARSSPRSSCR
jgi:sugar lactone lactonase YvrE